MTMVRNAGTPLLPGTLNGVTGVWNEDGLWGDRSGTGTRPDPTRQTVNKPGEGTWTSQTGGVRERPRVTSETSSATSTFEQP